VLQAVGQGLLVAGVEVLQVSLSGLSPGFERPLLCWRHGGPAFAVLDLVLVGHPYTSA
jgi:hypothetical protein